MKNFLVFEFFIFEFLWSEDSVQLAQEPVFLVFYMDLHFAQWLLSSAD